MAVLQTTMGANQEMVLTPRRKTVRLRVKVLALLVAAGIAALVFAGVATAGPMGGGMGGMGSTTSTTMMQPGAGMGGGMSPSTGTTMMQPGTGVGPSHMFADVAAGDWFAEYAQSMASHNFMSGFADGTFGPDLPITRGQFAAILGRMMNVQPAAGTTFADTEGFWGAGMVEAMAHMGIIAGHADGTFGPYGSITREQMAAIMDRAWDAMHEGATLGDMTEAMTQMMQSVHDVSGSWAAPQIAHMMQMGVFRGSDGMFHPTDTATRAEAAAAMWRWFAAGGAQQ
jgi:hypothetical protein